MSATPNLKEEVTEGYDAFQKRVVELKTKFPGELIVVLFTGSEGADGKSWCPDCVVCELNRMLHEYFNSSSTYFIDKLRFQKCKCTHCTYCILGSLCFNSGGAAFESVARYKSHRNSFPSQGWRSRCVEVKGIALSHGP